MTWQPINLGAPEYARPTEPPYICGVIYRGKRHALSGPPESAKTLLALVFGLEHMRAGEGQFALVDFEMGEHGTRLLLEDLGATADEVAAVYYLVPDGPPNESDVDAIVDAGVTLVIIDALAGAYDASGLDDNKRSDAERFSRTWVTPLWQRGITTIGLDHVVKNSDARGKYAIGSERKLGAIDVHLGLEAVRQLRRGSDGLIRVTTHKDRPGHLARPRAAEVELRSNPDTQRINWTFRTAAADQANRTVWRPTGLMENVSRYLESQAEPVARGTIERAIGGNAKFVRQAIDFLVADGHAREMSGPRNARLYSTEIPYREPDLVPKPGRRQTPDLVPTSSPAEPHEQTEATTSSHPVPTSSPKPLPTSSPRPSPSRGDEDELERLLTKYADIASST